MTDIFFEDLAPGAVTTYGAHRVDRDEMTAFAREFDAQPFHVDEASARASAVGHLIASGWYTTAVQMRMLCDAWLLRSASLGGPGIEELKWLRPVVAGDLLSVRQTVLDARVSRSRPEMGFVRFRMETLNGAGDAVMSQIHVGMFGRRDVTAPAAGGAAEARRPDTGPPARPPSGPVLDARCFEEVELGVVVPLGDYAFTPENVVAFAGRYDPQPFHLSDEAARRSHFGRLAASGWHTGAAWMKSLVAHRTASVARAAAEGATPPRFGVSPGFRDLKWLRPVHAGETIRFATEAVEKRPSASRPGWGLVFSRNTGWNEAGEQVYEFTGGGFWGLRDAS